jgi:hypothetical protein
MKVVARNELGPPAEENFRAALTPSAGQILSRSDRALYCIGGQPSKPGSANGGDGQQR